MMKKKQMKEKLKMEKSRFITAEENGEGFMCIQGSCI